MLKSGTSVRIDPKTFYRKLMSSCPPDNSFRDLDMLLIREHVCESEDFLWAHPQVS